MTVIHEFSKEMIRILRAKGYIENVYAVMPKNPSFPYFHLFQMKEGENGAQGAVECDFKIVSNKKSSEECICMLEALFSIDFDEDLKMVRVSYHSSIISDVKFKQNSEGNYVAEGRFVFNYVQ